MRGGDACFRLVQPGLPAGARGGRRWLA
jgi:hypothetical protein